MPDITLEGDVELQKAIAKNIKLENMKRIIKNNGSNLQKKAQKNADFKGHYKGKKFVTPSGNLKRSIGLEISANGLTATVEPTAEYAAYVEFGTRFMNAQPYLKPAFEEQKNKLKQDLNKLVK
jgi:HK97 gp10 family phage protein